MLVPRQKKFRVEFQELSSPTILKSLPDDKKLDWSKLKQIADDILKVHLKTKNKCNLGVENIVRKGFPQLYIFSASKCGIVW